MTTQQKQFISVRLGMLTFALCLTSFVAVLFSQGCAVTNAPQIEPETRWRLNTASTLTDLNADYVKFFQDVGVAQRQGTLSTQQVQILNAIGGKFRIALQVANQEFKAYVAAPSTDKRIQVTNLVLEASQIFVELTTQRGVQ